MSRALSTPPLEPLLEILARLEAEGIACALGGSGLLAALGLADVVRDWDLTAEASLECLIPIARGMPFETAGSDALHADAKLMFPAERIEVIARFAFHVPGGVVRIPTVVTGRWRGVPLGSPEAWALAYDLLGRAGKRDLLLDYLRARGHDRGMVARLLAQPLPEGIARTLAAL
ncbi:MAG TPA: hypothetical protein VMS88_05735 [Terriglobales bacterium]|nr:hypothetical protein [Terriglobales bacterium]